MSQGPNSDYPDNPNEQPRNPYGGPPQNGPEQSQNPYGSSYGKPSRNEPDQSQNPYGSSSRGGYGGSSQNEPEQPQNPYGSSSRGRYDRSSSDPSQGESQNPYGTESKGEYGRSSEPSQNPYGTPSQGGYGSSSGGSEPSQNPYGSPSGNSYGSPSGNDYGSSSGNSYGSPSGNDYGSSSRYDGPPPDGTPPGYGSNYVPGNQLPLSDALQQLPNQYVKVLTNPSPQPFAEEVGKARWDVVGVQIGGLAVILAILHSLYFALFNPARSVSIPDNPQLEQAIRQSSSPGFFSTVISVLLGYFVMVGVVYLVARAFGGRANFLQQSYTTALWYVPLSIAASLLMFIPCLGNIASLALGIYGIVLNVFNVQAIHRLPIDKSAIAVIAPILIIILAVCGCAMMLAMTMGGHR